MDGKDETMDENEGFEQIQNWGWIDLGVNVYPARGSLWDRHREDGKLMGCPRCGAAIVVGDLLTDLREQHIEWHAKVYRSTLSSS